MKNIFNQTERETIKFWVDDFGTFLSNGGMRGVLSNARTRRDIVLCVQIARNINAIVYIYKRYFDIMQNRGWEIISPKPQVNKFAKLILVIRAFLGK